MPGGAFDAGFDAGFDIGPEEAPRPPSGIRVAGAQCQECDCDSGARSNDSGAEAGGAGTDVLWGDAAAHLRLPGETERLAG
jgi:hypothetical protein